MDRRAGGSSRRRKKLKHFKLTGHNERAHGRGMETREVKIVDKPALRTTPCSRGHSASRLKNLYAAMVIEQIYQPGQNEAQQNADREHEAKRLHFLAPPRCRQMPKQNLAQIH